MRKILLVEDDPSIVSSLTGYLKDEGYLVESVAGQKDALLKMDSESYAIALLDISLADGNGFSICSAIKHKGNMPVIFLTASDDEYSVVTGLDLGADDYISKPFRPRELLSRINSVLRRSNEAQKTLSCQDIRVDINKALVTKNNAEIYLSALEYRLLLVFLQSRYQKRPRHYELIESFKSGISADHNCYHARHEHCFASKQDFRNTGWPISPG